MVSFFCKTISMRQVQFWCTSKAWQNNHINFKAVCTMHSLHPPVFIHSAFVHVFIISYCFTLFAFCLTMSTQVCTLMQCISSLMTFELWTCTCNHCEVHETFKNKWVAGGLDSIVALVMNLITVWCRVMSKILLNDTNTTKADSTGGRQSSSPERT